MENVIEKRCFGFSVQGEFITNFAREKFYNEGKFDYAVELLMSCMETDQLSKREIKNMAYDILNGEAELHGIYPGDDYGFRYLDVKNDRYDIGSAFSKLIDENKNIEKRMIEAERKINFLCDFLSDYKKKECNKEYESIFEDTIFPDVEVEEPENNLLNSFMKRYKTDAEDDYGWLEPNGDFHPADWGEHSAWADLYMEENHPDILYGEDDVYMQTKCGVGLIGAADWLVERGWVLLHNPGQGIAFPTKNPLRRYTKAQKEFLYDYYIKRDCHKEANAFFKEDDF